MSRRRWLHATTVCYHTPSSTGSQKMPLGSHMVLRLLISASFSEGQTVPMSIPLLRFAAQADTLVSRSKPFPSKRLSHYGAFIMASISAAQLRASCSPHSVFHQGATCTKTFRLLIVLGKNLRSSKLCFNKSFVLLAAKTT